MAALDFITALFTGFAGALAVQLVAFISAYKRKRVDIVDAAWGLSFVGIIAALLLSGRQLSPAVLIVDWLVIIWAVRLSSHIFERFLHSHTQDERYTNLMKNWPHERHWFQVFFKIFVLQAGLATLVSLPIVIITVFHPGINLFTWLGIGVWMVGFLIEAVADRQLQQFLRRPNRSELMQEGLWKYSRHPNYFGEVLLWWGIALVSCATPLWWLGLLGALIITWLICFVSGIPLAEARAALKKGWPEYKRRTSPLIPWPPKKRNFVDL